MSAEAEARLETSAPRGDGNGNGGGHGNVRASLTRRLTTLFTISSTALIGLAGWILLTVTRTGFETEDRHLVADKVDVLAQAMAEGNGDLAPLEERLRKEAEARHFNPYLARVSAGGEGGSVESPDLAATVPGDAFPPPSPTGSDGSDATYWRSPSGETFLLISSQRRPGADAGGPTVFQVALDVSHEEELVSHYRRIFGLVLLCGLLLSALAGAAVARHGLRPLGQIAQTAERISASNLEERVGPAGWPRELQSLARAFDAMLDRLNESFERLSRFSSNLAHEIRTPVNNLLGEAEVTLGLPRSAEEYRRALESMLEDCALLCRTIDCMLYLARADSEQLAAQCETLDARAEMQAVADFYEALAEEKGAAITCDGAATVAADQDLFRRALSNLVSNALKFSPPGGTVWIRATARGDGQVEVAVADEGPGIPEDAMPFVFDRFFRGDPARTRATEGTGLGLSIVRSIMQQHRGSVTIVPSVVGGVIATLCFPPPGVTDAGPGQPPRPPDAAGAGRST